MIILTSPKTFELSLTFLVSAGGLAHAESVIMPRHIHGEGEFTSHLAIINASLPHVVNARILSS